jgi:hypothetical protein
MEDFQLKKAAINFQPFKRFLLKLADRRSLPTIWTKTLNIHSGGTFIKKPPNGDLKAKHHLE